MLFEDNYEIREGIYYFNPKSAESLGDMNYLIYKLNNNMPRGNERWLEHKVEQHILKDDSIIFKVTITMKEDK